MEFYRRVRTEDGRQGKCIVCCSAYQKSWYAANCATHKAATRSTRLRRQQQLLESYLLFMQDKQCVDCGESDVVVLQFDHQGEKAANVSNLLRNAKNWSVVMEEIEKCEIVCANCHARRTAKQFGWRKALFTPS